jgi:tRNA 2-selenouridine synthase
MIPVLAQQDVLGMAHRKARLLATEGRVDELFESVMVLHYDPCYRRSTKRNYGPRPATMDLALDSLEPAGLEEAVRRLIELDARESIAAPVVSQ